MTDDGSGPRPGRGSHDEPLRSAGPGRGIDAGAFVARHGPVYEHSPWIARRTLERGALPGFLDEPGRDPAGELRSAEEAGFLGAAFAATLAAASDEDKLALVRAHPDLVGRAALAGSLTDDSAIEQSSAGLDRCTPDELARFRAANAAYRERFGFPFVMAVRGADRTAILAAFEDRLDNDERTELATALVEIDRIALLRLEALVAAGDGAGADGTGGDGSGDAGRRP